MRMKSQTYLNIILTVIAALMLISALRNNPQVGLSTPAVAQANQDGLTLGSEESAVQAQQGVAVGNMEIAKQVGEVAKALNNIAKSVDGLTAVQSEKAQTSR